IRRIVHLSIGWRRTPVRSRFLRLWPTPTIRTGRHHRRTDVVSRSRTPLRLYLSLHHTMYRLQLGQVLRRPSSIGVHADIRSAEEIVSRLLRHLPPLSVPLVPSPTSHALTHQTREGRNPLPLAR